MNSLIKKYIKKILSCLGILSIIEKQDKSVDPRRYWKGQIVDSPLCNVSLFNTLNNKKASTLTYNKESRDCVFLEPKEEIELKIQIKEEAHVKIGAVCDEKTISGSVEIYTSLGEKTELKLHQSKIWQDVTFTLKLSSKRLKIKNNCNAKIALAHPIIQHPYRATDKPHAPRNIILLLLDSLSCDAIGSYDANLAQFMPNTTRFFKNALQYTNCFSQSEWTYPSIYSLLMSRYPLDHGMCDLRNYTPGMTPNFKDTFPEHLRQLGYETFAYSTVKVFHPAFNAHIGFDRFIYDPFPQPTQTHKEICDQAISQLNINKDGRNFLFLHFLDSHAPWTNTSEFERSMLGEQGNVDPMTEFESLKRGHGDTKVESIFDDNGIEILHKRRNVRMFYMDMSLQSLFDYLEKTDQAENSVVALFSDHGFGHLSKGQPLLCNTMVNVPLLIRHPDIKPAEISSLVELNMDLGPTIVKIAGGNFRSAKGGLLPPIGGNEREFVLSESIFGSLYKIAIRDKTYVYHFCCKYDKEKKNVLNEEIRSEALFERKNEIKCVDVSAEYPDEMAKMRAILKKHLHDYSRGNY